MALAIATLINFFVQFALVIGDLHIPQRATNVPEAFKELLMPNKMQYVLSPGNIGCKEVSSPCDFFPPRTYTNKLSAHSLDPRMAGVLGSGQVPNARNKRRVRRLCLLPGDKSSLNWQHQNRSYSRSLGDAMGRP